MSAFQQLPSSGAQQGGDQVHMKLHLVHMKLHPRRGNDQLPLSSSTNPAVHPLGYSTVHQAMHWTLGITGHPVLPASCSPGSHPGGERYSWRRLDFGQDLGRGSAQHGL